MCYQFSSMHLFKWIRFVMQRCAVITEIQNLILQNKHVTLRDLFYRKIYLFKSQRGSNESVAFFTHLFEIPRWRLHVVSSPRGLVRGKMRFDILSGNRTNTISCYTAAEPYGVPIPAFPEQIGNIYLDKTVGYVMVVEKETIFSRILNTPIFHKLGNGILITSKGFPDIATRVFLSKVWRAATHYKSHFPFFIACDMDPWGIAIAKAYCFAESAEAMWYLPKDVYYPNYTIIHCDFSEAISLWGLPLKEVQDITNRDKNLLNAIQTKMVQDLLLVNTSQNNQFQSTQKQILFQILM
ncbi:uncharacterized protein LOC128883962 isoform X2 [Hylaeus volcanicus]|uniref:uncharacterized protein LOC128883962 isoform X2 n=1 Tax=Hylaeus volcanicus TaxID=313075 RepID=UPI0023B7DF3E|nr:uncharacterized protein LOC128883962 isoform X2 [Hylaeus volcanicus]